jgi:hypothetical protein
MLELNLPDIKPMIEIAKLEIRMLKNIPNLPEYSDKAKARVYQLLEDDLVYQLDHIEITCNQKGVQ